MKQQARQSQSRNFLTKPSPLRLFCCLIFIAGLALQAKSGLAEDSVKEWPFDRPALDTLRKSPRKVFAHYFTPFLLSEDNLPAEKDYYTREYLNPAGEKGKHQEYGGYLRERPLPRQPRPERDWVLEDMKEEVRRAVALGLDGFICDILDDEGAHFNRVKSLLEAAHQVDPGFKIVLMPDMEAKFKTHPERLAETIRTLMTYPAVYRMDDGRLVVAPYNAQSQTVDWWKKWLQQMNTNGTKIAFLPLFQNWEKYAAEFAPISNGMSDWGWRSPKAQAVWQSVPRRAHRYTSLWMMPVSPQDMRPRSRYFTEAGNSEAFRVMWQNAISGGADWVQLITWNDYSESTEISPSTGIQYAFYDLTAYYTTWFKTGQQPKITRDVLYYFHRTHSTSAVPSVTKKIGTLSLSPGSDPPSNNVELLAFLTQPGTLEIEINGQVRRKEASEGIVSFSIPLQNGRPTFRLLRAGKPSITVQSAFEISDNVSYQNLLYHAGSSSREPVTPATPGAKK